MCVPCMQVKPEFAAIERAAISEPGMENSLAREHYTEDIEKVQWVVGTHRSDINALCPCLPMRL